MDRAALDVFAVALVVPLAVWLFDRISPDPEGELSRKSGEFDSLRWMRIAGAMTIVCALPFGYLLWRAFTSVAPPAFSEADGSLVLRAGGLAWAAPAALLGLFCGGVACVPILRRFLGDRYAEFVAFSVRANGLRSSASGTRLMVAAGVLASVGAALLGDWSFAVTPTAIRFDPLFAVEAKIYAYGDVARIETLVNPGRKEASSDPCDCPGRGYAIRFRDGDSWSSHNDSSFATRDEIQAVLQTVSRRSSVPITEVEVIE
jgi:hypothetical protein